MASRSSASYRARRLERERERRQRQEGATGASTLRVTSAEPLGDTTVARAVSAPCAWCGGRITPAARGPIPKWCSATCRHRAWEQTRAAASGRCAVEVLERRVEVPVALVSTWRDWPLRRFLLHAKRLSGQRVVDAEEHRSPTRVAAVLALACRLIGAGLERHYVMAEAVGPRHSTVIVTHAHIHGH